MTGAEYAEIRRRVGTQAEVATLLGRATQTISNRENEREGYVIDGEAEYAMRYLGEHPEVVERLRE